jgi:hypothetical protein
MALETPGGSRDDTFRRLTFFSVLGGLCPLIPVPFVDDWALAQVQRRMLWEVARKAGVTLTPEGAKILAGGEDRSWPGCLGAAGWVFREVVGAILGKLFRTIFYFLTIRRSVRRSSETLHLGYLFAHDLRREKVPVVTVERARAIRQAVLATLQEVDAQPIYRTLFRDFRHSLSLLLQGAALFRRFLPRRKKRKETDLAGQSEVFERQEELLGGFTDRLAEDLWGNRAYFATLETAFDRNLPRAAS